MTSLLDTVGLISDTIVMVVSNHFMIEFKYHSISQNEPILDTVKVVKNLRLDRLRSNPNTIILTKDTIAMQ